MTGRVPRFDGYVFDLDGTVHLDGRVLPGVAETIAELRVRGARVIFVTNKPLEAPATYAAMLSAGGVPTVADDVVTSVDALLAYLAVHRQRAAVLPVAERVVCDALAGAGHRIVDDPTEADIVVVAFDRTFDYEKLVAAYRAVRAGAAIVATNPDAVCPTADGGLPDCAAMLAAIEACTGRHAEVIVGKPSAYMAHAMVTRLGLRPDQAVMVGDRLVTDVAMGIAAGLATVLVVDPTADPTNDPGRRQHGLVPDATISTLRELL